MSDIIVRTELLKKDGTKIAYSQQIFFNGESGTLAGNRMYIDEAGDTIAVTYETKMTRMVLQRATPKSESENRHES